MSLMEEKAENSEPKSLIINDLELKPYQYEEFLYPNGSIRIKARIMLSESQYNDIGKFQKYVRVIRQDIDDKPREMKLSETAWSKQGGKIKEQIMLVDEKEKDEIGLVDPLLKNLEILLAEQSLLIEELSTMLVSEGILSQEKIKEFKMKITEERVRNKRRDLRCSLRDLDEFESLEK